MRPEKQIVCIRTWALSKDSDHFALSQSDQHLCCALYGCQLMKLLHAACHNSYIPLYSGDWSWNLLYGHSLPLIQEGQLSVFGERMCTLLVNGCPGTVWLGWLDMTYIVLTGLLNSKHTKKETKPLFGTWGSYIFIVCTWCAYTFSLTRAQTMQYHFMTMTYFYGLITFSFLNFYTSVLTFSPISD